MLDRAPSQAGGMCEAGLILIEDEDFPGISLLFPQNLFLLSLSEGLPKTLSSVC